MADSEHEVEIVLIEDSPEDELSRRRARRAIG